MKNRCKENPCCGDPVDCERFRPASSTMTIQVTIQKRSDGNVLSWKSDADKFEVYRNLVLIGITKSQKFKDTDKNRANATYEVKIAGQP